MTRRLWLTLAALGAAAACYVVVTLPPASIIVPAIPPSTTVVGAYHIHTDRSDGSGSVDDVARAAAQAGLQFIILTDHGDGTRRPDPPAYRHGVLVIDGVEVSTRDGHVVALGLTDAAPYPLGGEARDVIEDIRRLGGWAVAAHPDSRKADLRWRGPATDGVEWINADSEWRDDSPGRLIRAAVHSLLRPAPAIAGLFAHPAPSVRRWDAWARTRLVPGLAAVDAHARIGIDEQSEPRVARTLLARPSYRHMFETLVQAVWLDEPLNGTAHTDADRVLDALRAGRTYSAVTAIARPAILAVTHDAGILEAVVPGAPAADVAILHRGQRVGGGAGRARAETGAPGLYRVEVRWPGHDVPWIMAAPVFIPEDRGVPAATDDPVPGSTPGDGPVLAISPGGAGWQIEHHVATTGAWRHDGQATVFDYTLAPGSAPGQYAALVHALDPSDSFGEVHFTVTASRPMRFSVQVRLPDANGGGERWVRSVYADTTPRAVRVRLEDFSPAGPERSRRPVAARLQSLLFVVDAPHTRPGDRGTLTIADLTLHPPSVRSGR